MPLLLSARACTHCSRQMNEPIKAFEGEAVTHRCRLNSASWCGGGRRGRVCGGRPRRLGKDRTRAPAAVACPLRPEQAGDFRQLVDRPKVTGSAPVPRMESDPRLARSQVVAQHVSTLAGRATQTRGGGGAVPRVMGLNSEGRWGSSRLGDPQLETRLDLECWVWVCVRDHTNRNPTKTGPINDADTSRTVRMTPGPVVVASAVA